MDKLFLDTNVVVDFLCGREGFYLPAAKLVTKGYNKEVELWCSTFTLSTASYILEKNHVKYSQIINMLTEFVKICQLSPIDQEVVESALSSDFTDFEDALQYFSAKKCGVEIIISRNKEDFAHSGLPVCLPTEYLGK